MLNVEIGSNFQGCLLNIFSSLQVQYQALLCLPMFICKVLVLYVEIGSNFQACLLNIFSSLKVQYQSLIVILQPRKNRLCEIL